MVTAQDIHKHLWTFEAGWVDDPSKSVDTFKAGNPETEVRELAVAWKAHMGTLVEATEAGCNVFVCHEPLYCDHHDVDESFFRFEAVQQKRDWLEERGMVVMRCHDVWDFVQEIGIIDSWAAALGLSNPLPESTPVYKVYDVAGRSAGDVAAQIAEGVSELGGEWVQLLGSEETPVTRLAIGVGAGTPFQLFVEKLEADMAVCTDDGYTFWREGALAMDMGVPLVVVNHCVAEDAGMRNLALHLEETFPGIPVHFFPQAGTAKLVRL